MFVRVWKQFPTPTLGPPKMTLHIALPLPGLNDHSLLFIYWKCMLIPWLGEIKTVWGWSFNDTDMLDLFSGVLI